MTSPRRPRWLTWRRSPSAPPPPGGLPCRALVELVTDYMEGALPATDRARFEAHIAACGDCTAYLEQMRLTLHLAGRLEPGDLDPRVERELREAFREWKAGGA